MNLEIITPEKIVYKGEVVSIILPGSKGVFQILKNHAPIISTLQKGKIKIKDSNNKEDNFNVSGGVLEFQNNNAIVLVD